MQNRGRIQHAPSTGEPGTSLQANATHKPLLHPGPIEEVVRKVTIWFSCDLLKFRRVQQADIIIMIRFRKTMRI